MGDPDGVAVAVAVGDADGVAVAALPVSVTQTGLAHTCSALASAFASSALNRT